MADPRPMNEGERMVWAAAFALQLQANGDARIPLDVRAAGTERTMEWLAERAEYAAAVAAHAVTRLRSAQPRRLAASDGDTSARMLTEMIGGADGQ